MKNMTSIRQNQNQANGGTPKKDEKKIIKNHSTRDYKKEKEEWSQQKKK